MGKELHEVLRDTAAALNWLGKYEEANAVTMLAVFCHTHGIEDLPGLEFQLSEYGKRPHNCSCPKCEAP